MINDKQQQQQQQRNIQNNNVFTKVRTTKTICNATSFLYLRKKYF